MPSYEIRSLVFQHTFANENNKAGNGSKSTIVVFTSALNYMMISISIL
jgi:hypothetical protein